MTKHILSLFTFLLFFQFVSAQEIMIKGRIYDSENKEPLVRSSVSIISGDSVILKAMSDTLGYFSVPGTLGDTLAISYIGYETKKYNLSEIQNTLDVCMHESEHNLEDIVVISYSIEKKPKTIGPPMGNPVLNHFYFIPTYSPKNKSAGFGFIYDHLIHIQKDSRFVRNVINKTYFNLHIAKLDLDASGIFSPQFKYRNYLNIGDKQYITFAGDVGYYWYTDRDNKFHKGHTTLLAKLDFEKVNNNSGYKFTTAAGYKQDVSDLLFFASDRSTVKTEANYIVSNNSLRKRMSFFTAAGYCFNVDQHINLYSGSPYFVLRSDLLSKGYANHGARLNVSLGYFWSEKRNDYLFLSLNISVK